MVKSGYTRKRLKRGSRFDMKTRVNTLSDGTRLRTFVKEGVVRETVPLDTEGRKHGIIHIFDDKGIVTEEQDWDHGRKKKLTVFTNYNSYIETNYEHDGTTNITTVIDGVKDNTVYNNVMGKEIRTEYFGVPLRRTDSIRHYHRSKIYSDIRYTKPKIFTVKR